MGIRHYLICLCAFIIIAFFIYVFIVCYSDYAGDGDKNNESDLQGPGRRKDNKAD